MASSKWHCLLFLMLCVLAPMFLISTNADDTIDCARHRKPWHLISDAERMQFITGFKTLRLNGVLAAFAETHALEGVAFENIHKTSEFFFWHSYFVWEMETQFRSLGDEYRCFSMPYWDVTNDADYLPSLTSPDDIITYLPIFNSFLGGNGNPDNNYCLEDDIWNVNEYKTELLCASNEILPNCCLKRQCNTDITMANSSELINSFRFERFKAFQDIVSLIHGKIHKFMAISDEIHMYSNNAAEDPIFVLLHSFVDYIRAMRTDCWNYDQISINDIDKYVPFSYDSYIVDQDSQDGTITKQHLNNVMDFAYIGESEWSQCNKYDITSRMMYDISLWNISYELGSFWENKELQDLCGDKINDTWFYNTQDGDYKVNNIQKENILNKLNDLKHDTYKSKAFMTLFYVIIAMVCSIVTLYYIIRKYVMILKLRDKYNNGEIKHLINYNNHQYTHNMNSVLYGSVDVL